MRRAIFSIIALLTFMMGCAAETDYIKVYTVKGKFADVKDDVVMAIQDEGLVVNNTSYIGKMLDRTGKDLGFKKKIYLHAQAVEFCSATVSRKTMEANPHNIVFCPYVILIYELPKEPGKIYIAFRRPDIVGSAASKKSLKAVETLLDKIIKEAVG